MPVSQRVPRRGGLSKVSVSWRYPPEAMAILPLGQAGARKSLSPFYHFRKIGVNEEIIKKILRMEGWK